MKMPFPQFNTCGETFACFGLPSPNGPVEAAGFGLLALAVAAPPPDEEGDGDGDSDVLGRWLQLDGRGGAAPGWLPGRE
jgi:hypothetical protein